MKIKSLLTAASVVMLAISPTLANARIVSEPLKPLYPISPYVVKVGHDTAYPSVAGEFLVFGQRSGHEFRVVRVSKNAPNSSRYEMKPLTLNDEMRYGVAIDDGSIGYVSNRMGPISAWMWQGKGDGQVSIGNMATYRGGMAPFHLNAASDGSVWCFDSTFQKSRYNQMLSEYTKHPSFELVGQQWRSYDSDSFRHKQGYKATKTGKRNKLESPALFVFSRSNSGLVMIPNAFNGAVSPDGKRIAFVREVNGNYDIWVQNVDGSDLIQLTSSPYGDFEPAWSPDGNRLLFVSNRDSEGDVIRTSIYMMDMSTNAVTRLTRGKATDGGPAWLNNHSVVFHSDRYLGNAGKAGSNWNIWKLDLQ